MGLRPVGVHTLEPPQLACGLGERLGGKSGFLELGAVFLDLARAGVRLAQLRLDRAQLFAQDVLALAARHLLLGLGLDLCLDGRHLELATQERVNPAQSGERITGLQHFLRLGESKTQVRCHEIRQPARVRDGGGDGEDLGGEILERQELLDARAHRPHQSLRFDAPLGLLVRREHPHPGPQRRVLFDEALDFGFCQPLHEHLHPAIGQAQGAHHHGDRSHAVELIGGRLFHVGIALRYEQDQPIARQGVIHGSHGRLPPHEQRQHHVREHDVFAQRKQREFFRDLELRERSVHGL